MTRNCQVGSVCIGPDQPLTIIAGPCLLESQQVARDIAEQVRDACAALGLSFIFKASFDKANRSSITSPRGPGLERGLDWLSSIASDLNLPITTDIHAPAQAEPLANAIDLIQIPAFLCRQTDLLEATGCAAAEHHRAVSIKKGQFLSPGEMVGPITKLSQANCTNTLLIERGTTFGYHRLVNDFLGMGDLMNLDLPNGSPPVCFDATHSTQTPGTGSTTGGRPEHAPLLARAAVAAGVHAVFLECHPNPDQAQSDASTMLKLSAVGPLLAQLAAIHQALQSLS